MRWALAGALLASCACAQAVFCPAIAGSDRGQYCVSLKIMGDTLVIDQDAFQVPPSMIRFEADIRKVVRDTIAAIAPQAFSSDFLADLLKQTPDSGLVLNDEEVDPESGTLSFSILPLFDPVACLSNYPRCRKIAAPVAASSYANGFGDWTVPYGRRQRFGLRSLRFMRISD